MRPLKAGLARLLAMDVDAAVPVAQTDVEVGYDGVPPSGLAVLVLAGAILFLGAGLTLGKLFRTRQAATARSSG